MNIELKNLKYFASGSEETNAFTATVYIDGERTFVASNSGKGECCRFEPVKGKSYSDIHQVESWINTQPDYVDDDLNITLNDNLDFTITRLVDRELLKRELLKILKKRIVLYDPNPESGGLKQLSSKLNPVNLATYRNTLEATFHNCLILNELDLEKALALYSVSNSTTKMTAVYQKIKDSAE